MAPYRVEAVTDILQMNQEVPVRIIEIDKMGRVNLSLIYDEKGDSGDRGDRGGSRPERDERGGHRTSGGDRPSGGHGGDRSRRRDNRPRR
jgi:polyribonucleotide nucleotidyltransferase